MNKRTQRTVGLTALLFAPLVTACPQLDDRVAGPEIAPVRIVQSFATEPSDAFTVNTHRLAGDILEVDVSYSGGCQTHEFVGFVGSDIAESAPVQMSGRIAHDDRDDPCDSIVTGTITFDLSPLRSLYLGAYGVSSSTIILHFEPISSPIRYTF